MAGDRVYEVFRYKVDVSIQTEPDGTWRNNTYYEARMVIRLVWYNEEFLPLGITIESSPRISYSAWAWVNYTSWVYNVNITDVGVYPWTTWTARFQTGSLYSGEEQRVELTPYVDFYVYNGSFGTYDFRGPNWWASRLHHTFEGQTIYLYGQAEEPMPASQMDVQNLIEQAEDLIEQINDINRSLAYMNNLVLILVVLLVSSIIINVALGFFMRRAKKQETISS